jgi:MFS family permease
LTQIILSDLVTLKERGTYNGLFGLYVYPLLACHYLSHGLLSAWAFGGGIGPLVGGALAHHTTWRWLFCTSQDIVLRVFRLIPTQDLNIPIAGVAFVLLMVFLALPTPPGSIHDKFAKIDWMYGLSYNFWVYLILMLPIIQRQLYHNRFNWRLCHRFDMGWFHVPLEVRSCIGAADRRCYRSVYIYDVRNKMGAPSDRV